MLPLHKLTTLITGKITLADPEGQPAEYVYQRTRAGTGNLRLNESNDRLLRRFVPRIDNPTAGQRPVRQRFQDAIAIWNALSPEEKADYHHRARSLPMTGYNLFHQEYAKAHVISIPPESAVKARYLASCGIPWRRTTLAGYALSREFSETDPPDNYKEYPQ